MTLDVPELLPEIAELPCNLLLRCFVEVAIYMSSFKGKCYSCENCSISGTVVSL